LVGPYVHGGLNLYIFTSKSSNKMKQIEKNPSVSKYIQNKYDLYKEYESVLINGKAFVLTEEFELNCTIDKLC
jgi:nitroimidazol reductase NimA-like FMN-containing flavoprotein (pyridoxamine 5'-phosphate oxidase superfamily)